MNHYNESPRNILLAFFYNPTFLFNRNIPSFAFRFQDDISKQKTLAYGVTGNTSDFGSEESRFEP